MLLVLWKERADSDSPEWIRRGRGRPEHTLIVLTLVKTPREKAGLKRTIYLNAFLASKQDTSPLGEKSKALHQQLLLTGIYLFCILKTLSEGGSKTWGTQLSIENPVSLMSPSCVCSTV